MNGVHKINLDIFDFSGYNQENNLDLYLKEIKMLNTVFEQFIKESPVSVISRSAMERIFTRRFNAFCNADQAPSMICSSRIKGFFVR